MKKEVIDLKAGDVLHFPTGLYTTEVLPFIVESTHYLADNKRIDIRFTNGLHFSKDQFDKVEVE